MIPKINSAHGSDTRNIINRAIETLNSLGIDVQTLVAEGQLTDEQYTELITVINGLIKSGHVDKSDLTSEFKGEIEGFNTRLAENGQDIADLETKKIDKNGSGQVNWANIAQDARENITGDKVAVVGVDAVITENITDNAVTPSKTDFLNVSPNLFDKTQAVEGRLNASDGNLVVNKDYWVSGYISIVDGINYTMTKGYSYAFYDSTKTFLSGGSGFGVSDFSIVPPSAAIYIRFEIHKANAPINSFMFVKGNALPTNYQAYGNFFLSYKNVEPPSNLDTGNFSDVFLLRNNLSSGFDLNSVTKEGNYTGIANGNYLNTPIDFNPIYSFLIENKALFKGGNRWFIQTLTENGGSFRVWIRRLDKDGGGTQPWVRTGGKGSSELSSSVVVNLGDSIFGNTRGENSVSNHISERTGATVHNIGFGGSRIAEHFEGWDAFSLYRLADEIVKDDTDPTKWQLQETGIIDDAGGAKAAYFRDHLDLLKSIDFNQVDYVTIAGGTNDYTASVLLDNESNKYDTTTFSGSLRYSLEKIMGKFKHLKILLCTPTYRFWVDASGAFVEDSDTRLYGSQGLPDFVQKEIEVAREYHVPVVDNYFELGINKFNRQEFFPSNDGTHPNPKGNEKLGSRIGSKLISEF